jgi:inosine-uridine nucleoside N-ribohydrolase
MKPYHLKVVKYAFLLFCCLESLVSSTGTISPIPVILDTDIGDDADDMFALFLLLSRPDVYDVRLIQVSTFNTTKRAQIVCSILDQLNRTDIPVAMGVYTGEKNCPECPAANDYDLSTYPGVLTNGTDQMKQLLATSTPEAPIFVIEIAPATSLGRVVYEDPSLAKNAVVCAMSGSIYRGYGNSSDAEAEYNVKEDILASQALYNSTWAWPMATAPLDTTVWMQFFAPQYTSLLAANNSDHAYAQLLIKHFTTWYNNGGKDFGAIKPFSPTTGTSTMYDPLAAYMCGRYAGWRSSSSIRISSNQSSSSSPPPPSPDFFPFVTTQALPLAVDDNGMTKVTSGAQTVFAAVFFPHGEESDIGSIADDILGSIIAAP